MQGEEEMPTEIQAVGLAGFFSLFFPFFWILF